MKCKKCNFENDADAIFCENCGTKIDNSSDTDLENRLKQLDKLQMKLAEKTKRSKLFLILTIVFGILSVTWFALYLVEVEDTEYYRNLYYNDVVYEEAVPVDSIAYAEEVPYEYPAYAEEVPYAE
jgi:hypothetical protein